METNNKIENDPKNPVVAEKNEKVSGFRKVLRGFGKAVNTAWKKTGASKLWDKMGSRGRFAVGVGMLAFSHTVLIVVPVVHEAAELSAWAIMLRESTRLRKGLANVRMRFPKTSAKIVNKINNSKDLPDAIKGITKLTDPKKAFTPEEYAAKKEKFAASRIRRARFWGKVRKTLGIKPAAKEATVVAQASKKSHTKATTDKTPVREQVETKKRDVAGKLGKIMDNKKTTLAKLKNQHHHIAKQPSGMSEQESLAHLLAMRKGATHS